MLVAGLDMYVYFGFISMRVCHCDELRNCWCYPLDLAGDLFLNSWHVTPVRTTQISTIGSPPKPPILVLPWCWAWEICLSHHNCWILSFLYFHTRHGMARLDPRHWRVPVCLHVDSRHGLARLQGIWLVVVSEPGTLADVQLKLRPSPRGAIRRWSPSHGKTTNFLTWILMIAVFCHWCLWILMD